MNCIVRRQPVVNRQQGVIAARLVVQAQSGAAAVAALNGLADIWPATRDVLVAIQGATIDAALLGWQAPANALLELPAAWVATVAGQELAAQFAGAGTRLALAGFAPGMAVPGNAKFRYVLADASKHPQMRAAPGMPLALGLIDQSGFADAMDNGYDGAAGWFFLHDLPPGAGKLNPSHAQIIHILNRVRQNAEIGEIETALKQNIAISFKLLRYINSAGFGLAKRIESFRHAVTLIGYDKLNKWLSLLLVTASQAVAAPALMQAAIARGRFMEIVAAGRVVRGELDNLFIAGSFSLLDALLGTRIDAVLGEMNLPPAIGAALLQGTGPYAAYLALALACEQGGAADLAAQAAVLGLSMDTINRAQIEALAFADSLQLG